MTGMSYLKAHFTSESTHEFKLESDFSQRRSITFLLGEDKPGYNYFELAEEHFSLDTQEKTDLLVKSCRSIEDMIQYLNEERGSKSWGTIQVVLHGNPYNGLSVSITKSGDRATSRKLVKAMMDGSLPKLQTDKLDSTTRINFWACGIGKNPFIKISLESFFQLPDGSVPQIYPSPHFVIFKEIAANVPAVRLSSTFWPYIFKRGYRPGDLEISNALKQQYPESEVNWLREISNASDGESSAVSQNSFHIPVSWTVIYPTKESRPDVNTTIQKLDWIRSQDVLMEQISETGISIDKFTWTVNKIIHTDKNGEKVPAIKGIGMTTVLCFLEPL